LYLVFLANLQDLLLPQHWLSHRFSWLWRC